MLRSLKVIFSKQKVKEKNREYSRSYRERSGGTRPAKLRERIENARARKQDPERASPAHPHAAARARLRRVLRKGARLYHYTGWPGKHRGLDIQAGARGTG